MTRAHVHLVEGGEHGGGRLRFLEAARDGLAQLGHAHALFARRRRRRRRTARPEPAPTFGVSAGCDGAPLAMASSTSPFSTWPRLPEPCDLVDREIALGEQLGCGRRRRHLALFDRPRRRRSWRSWPRPACRSSRAGARPPARPLRGLVAGSSCACAAWPTIDAEQRADADRLAFLGGDLGERAGGRRRHLDRHLVGLELDQRLVGGDGVADLLEPFADGRFGDGFAEGGNADFGSHCALSVSVGSIRRARLRGSGCSCARCFDIRPVAGDAAAGRPV